MSTEDGAHEWRRCDECRSEYIASTSKMLSLCPECSHHLYGYDNCDHSFEGGRCRLCGWDGQRSKYILKLIAGSN